MISNLKIISIRTEKSSFELNANYIKTEEHNHALAFSTNVLVNAKDEHRGIIRLACHINEDNQENDPFTMEVVMMGEFYTEDKPFEEYIINSMSLLFPYLRAHISTVTSISGVETLNIPAVNIYELLEQSSLDETEEN